MKLNLSKGFNEKKEFYNLNAKRVLILNDIHFPYHNKKALELALEYGKQNKADCIILNGDSIDMAAISRFLKDSRLMNLQNELDVTEQFLYALRKVFKNAKILFKIGNHELRLQKYLYEHSELLSLKCFTISSLLNFQKYKITEIESNQLIRYGKLTIGHGHEIGASGINPARTTLLKSFCNIAFGHLHRIDEYFMRGKDESVFGSWSMGCLCQLNPDYMPYNSWNNGFGFVSLTDKLGNFRFQNLKIINGRIY